MPDLETNADFENLLDYIKDSRGFDFTGYRRSSLMRRVTKRMGFVNIDSYEDYLTYLEAHPEEFLHLFNTLLINVTAFFRDRAAWDYLIGETLPAILARKSAREPIRVWSAGCASGAEPYSLAIALLELVGVDRFRDRVKIYATDVDEEALAYARQGSYSVKEVEDLSPEQIDTYFEKSGDRYVFRKDLRRSLIFGRHDLIQDAPISKIDLLVCRNTLMYFNAETQARILSRFYFALNSSGYLFLGKAEMLLSHSDLFDPSDLRQRIFTKVHRVGLRDRLMPLMPLQATGAVVENIPLLSL